MPLNLFYTMVQKSKKWPKLKSGGSCLKCTAYLENSICITCYILVTARTAGAVSCILISDAPPVTGVCAHTSYYPGQKKEPSLRFAARRTLFHVWYHARSQAISAGQGPIRDCPRLLPCADRAWSSMISHVEQRSSRRESRRWFFFLARVVVHTILPHSRSFCG